MHTRTSKILRLPLVPKVNGLVNITLKHRPNWMSWTHITTRWWGTECSNTITTCKSRRTVAQTNHCNSRQWAWNSIERLWNEIWSTTWNTSPHAWTKKDPDSTSNTNSPYSLWEDHWKISLSKCFDHYRQIITHTHIVIITDRYRKLARESPVQKTHEDLFPTRVSIFLSYLTGYWTKYWLTTEHNSSRNVLRHYYQ